CSNPLRSETGSAGPADIGMSRSSPGVWHGKCLIAKSGTLNLESWNFSRPKRTILKNYMRFSVDAHAIGCHLTGNEVYIRNLLTHFARLDRDNEFFAYLSKPHAEADVPRRFTKHRVSENPFQRLGFDLPRRVRTDRPDLLHVQYTAPLKCKVPLVVSVHDVSFLEFPQYFTRFRATQLK